MDGGVENKIFAVGERGLGSVVGLRECGGDWGVKRDWRQGLGVVRLTAGVWSREADGCVEGHEVCAWGSGGGTLLLKLSLRHFAPYNQNSID